MRKTWIIAVLILIGGVFAYSFISKMKKAPKKRVNTAKVITPYMVVKNSSLPLVIDGSGQVRSKDRIDIYSEVSGVLEKADKDFRTGTHFAKGELMIKINDSEFRSGLYAQRSSFENLITGLLPDIKLEFPDQFNKWYNYLTSIDIEKPLNKLPATNSKKEKFFITGRKVYSSYYNIRNLEERLAKYTIRAPFNGVVTGSNVNPGTLIRVGQKIGVFSNTDLFEIELSLTASDANLISIGDKVDIISPEDGSIWLGKVARMNAAIDINTQTVSVFVESSDKGLREGMFVKARIAAGKIDNAFEIPRDIVVENSWVYSISDDSTLTKSTINAVRFLDKSVIVSGFPDGTKIVSRNIAGVFPGMKVFPQNINK